jgi:hypothetical protein
MAETALTMCVLVILQSGWICSSYLGMELNIPICTRNRAFHLDICNEYQVRLLAWW